MTKKNKRKIIPKISIQPYTVETLKKHLMYVPPYYHVIVNTITGEIAFIDPNNE